jgi:prepilin-type N-terminal cleavage/methylation domain-containing protein
MFIINKKAYTLVELSIVLVVISVFISSGLKIFTNNIVQTKTVNTKEKMQIVYKALAEYLMENKKLPRPADLAKSRDSDANIYDESINCDSTNFCFGAVPIVKLHLSSNFAEDDFGNKILYVVDSRFSKSSANFNALNFSNDGDRGIINNTFIMLLLSSGSNSCGSYKINGIQNDACNPDADENENADNDISFILNSTDPDFDDIIIAKNYNDFLQELDMSVTYSKIYFQ